MGLLDEVYEFKSQVPDLELIDCKFRILATVELTREGTLDPTPSDEAEAKLGRDSKSILTRSNGVRYSNSADKQNWARYVDLVVSLDGTKICMMSNDVSLLKAMRSALESLGGTAYVHPTKKRIIGLPIRRSSTALHGDTFIFVVTRGDERVSSYETRIIPFLRRTRTPPGKFVVAIPASAAIVVNRAMTAGVISSLATFRSINHRRADSLAKSDGRSASRPASNSGASVGAERGPTREARGRRGRVPATRRRLRSTSSTRRRRLRKYLPL